MTAENHQPVRLREVSLPAVLSPPVHPGVPLGAPAAVYEAHLAELHQIHGDTSDPQVALDRVRTARKNQSGE